LDSSVEEDFVFKKVWSKPNSACCSKQSQQKCKINCRLEKIALMTRYRFGLAFETEKTDVFKDVLDMWFAGIVPIVIFRVDPSQSI